jgi:hypothetical protein
MERWGGRAFLPPFNINSTTQQPPPRRRPDAFQHEAEAPQTDAARPLAPPVGSRGVHKPTAAAEAGSEASAHLSITTKTMSRKTKGAAAVSTAMMMGI